MTKEKFQLILSFACFGLAILLFAGTTFAYFSDTKQMTNTMTAGNVSIELSEAAVKNVGGNLVKDESKDRILGGTDVVTNDYGKIYPGMTIYKDPTIKNTGDEPAWVAAKITVTDGSGDLSQVIGYDSYAGIDIKELLSGGILGRSARLGIWNGLENVRYTDDFAIVQKPNPTEGTYEFFIFILQPLEADETAVLFDTLSVPSYWTNEDMQQLAELTIHVQAYAVQLFDLNSCYDAMVKAFSSHFPFPVSDPTQP